MRYDGPFEIIQKISVVAYRLRLPASYGIHPVINIAHLEVYRSSPEEFGERIQQSLNRDDFEQLPEYEVESIVDEKWSKSRNGRKTRLFRVRFLGYSSDFDEWLPATNLRNAPDILKAWHDRNKPQVYSN